jgi:hypothetical protein
VSRCALVVKEGILRKKEIFLFRVEGKKKRLSEQESSEAVANELSMYLGCL